MAKRLPLLEALQERILLTDGATGTRFYHKGVPRTQCYEELNLINPDLVLTLHQEYIDAGADILQTNTFSANRSKLKEYKLEHLVHEINFAACKLARRAAGRNNYISGSIGPLRYPTDADMSFSEEEIFDIFREQAHALYFGGVDLISLETFARVRDLKIAIEAVQDVVPKDMLILPQVAYVEVASTGRGDQLVDIVKMCAKMGMKMIGANCGMGPHLIHKIVQMLVQHSKLPVAAVPNAGYPEYHEGRIRYMTTPEYMAGSVAELVASGANILGGCCGTTPAHIKMMADVVKDLKPVDRSKITPITFKPAVEETQEKGSKQWDILADLDKRLLWTVEVDPPAGLDTTQFFKGVELFKDLGVDGINIAENPLGRSRMSTTVLGNLVQSRYDIAAIVHITGRDRNIVGLHSELLGAAQCNVASILAVTGDPSSAGDYPWAKSVFDVNSFGLVELLDKMNHGLNLAGNSIDRPANFSIGVAFNASKARMDNEVKRLQKKVAFGAHYAQTQPLYEVARIKEMLDKTEHIGIPIFIGILPVVSYRNAEFLHNEFPGIHIPDKIREHLRKCNGDKKEERKISLDLMTELMVEVKEQAKGFYVVPQFNRFKMIRQLIENVRQS